MRLLNLDMDDLHLRGAFCVEYGTAEKEEVFKLNLGSRGPINNLFISNELIFKEGHFLNTGWLLEQASLLENRFQVYFNDTLARFEVIVSNKTKGTRKNILFTSLYTSDCSGVHSNLEIGATIEGISRVQVIACGYLPDKTGSLYPNLALVIPDTFDYRIAHTSADGGIVYTLYSGKTGCIKTANRRTVWLSPAAILPLLKRRSSKVAQVQIREQSS